MADLGIGGGGGISIGIFRFAPRHSSCPPKSADEGAVEALLWREELSVEAVFVVLDDPLPLVKEVRRKARQRGEGGGRIATEGGLHGVHTAVT